MKFSKDTYRNLYIALVSLITAGAYPKLRNFSYSIFDSPTLFFAGWFVSFTIIMLLVLGTFFLLTLVKEKTLSQQYIHPEDLAVQVSSVVLALIIMFAISAGSGDSSE